MRIYVDTDIPYEGLTSDLGYWLWNVLMVQIPYDTGNLRSAFKMKNNSSRKISFIFDDSEAYYVEFLEEGIGFVTKHKDFIKRDMVGVAIQELIYFIKTGKTGFITSRPNVTLRASQYQSPIGYERKILNNINRNYDYISASERQALSKIAYRGSDKAGVGYLRGYIKRYNSNFSFDNSRANMTPFRSKDNFSQQMDFNTLFGR